MMPMAKRMKNIRRTRRHGNSPCGGHGSSGRPPAGPIAVPSPPRSVPLVAATHVARVSASSAGLRPRSPRIPAAHSCSSAKR